jgi:hypothetical protein
MYRPIKVDPKEPADTRKLGTQSQNVENDTGQMGLINSRKIYFNTVK